MSILVDEATRVVVAGITGWQARAHTGFMRAYGTRVVAGVVPGRAGEDCDGVPVYDSFASALEEHQADAAVLFVPAAAAAESAIEAAGAGIPMILVCAEGVPQHDVARMIAHARRAGVRLVGPNSQGIISPGRAKMGGTGGDLPVTNLLFWRGPVGVLSRSGGMGSETCWLLSREGIGQSTYVSVGGDAMVGAPFSELMPIFQADPDTECVVLFGEPGSCAEEDAARLIGEGGFTKPVVAFIAGMVNESAPQGVSFGHAAAIIERGEGSPARKKALLREAGAAVVEDMREIPGAVRDALGAGFSRP